GPAGGVILRATAAIPVRSKGTPTVGGGGKGNGIHPLKHLAGLALQGLITEYEHEQARHAYYSKWILGKVYTSARQIVHSGSRLELIQNLLTTSKTMVHAYQQVPKSVKDRMLREYKEQEKARAEAALKAEKEARAKALKAKKEAAPPELTDEEYERIYSDYVYWASLEGDRRPEIPLGSYRAEDGVVRIANGDPDFKYYDDWKQNYPGDFLVLSNQEGITPEEQRWMSYANLTAEPFALDGRGGEGRAFKNEFSKMSKEEASENARLARVNVRRIQQRIDQKSITTKNASEPIENASEVMPSKAGKPKEKPPKMEGTGQGLENRGYKPQPDERTTTREDWKAQDREARIRSNLSQSSPISIPPTASVKIQSKTGYEQIQFKWSDGYYKYEGRWHTRTPGAPQNQGNTWVIERTTPGNTTGQQRTYHILTGDNQWTPRHEWQTAINARKNGTATAEQNKMLENGHWPAP
ncbi:hypothetical protein GXB80_22600, partial [Paenibacillus polymyxa]|nr:hypothetical protein [Paenibacillus polymyxa]